MRKIIAALALSAALAACATQAEEAAEASAAAPTASHIDAALANPTRPEADRARDAARKPGEMLAFAGVQPGQTVADFIPGAGYFTRILAGAVGPEGRVFAMTPAPPPNASGPPAINAVPESHPNVTLVPLSATSLSVPEPVDVFFTAQNYHDLHLTQLNLDVPAVNQLIFNAVKPGGVLLVIDHAAVAGADVGVANTLHRIDQAIARRELEAAGFVFEAESDALRNPADPRTGNVFDPAIRGQTDQFIMRFRRPAA